MTETRIGYARCATDTQDLAAQKLALEKLGVAPDRIYADRGLRGASRARHGLDRALDAIRTGDTLVVPKLVRLARSLADARDIADSLAARGVKLAVGASVYDPADPMGKMFFDILASLAEFAADVIHLRGKQPKLSDRQRPKLSERQRQELYRMYDTDEYAISDLAEVFSVSRPTVYRTLLARKEMEAPRERSGS